MIDVRRRLERRARRIARGPLTRLLQWVAVHALAPYASGRAEPWMARAAEDSALEILGRLADRGALLYFGIRDATDLGSPPVSFVALGLYPDAVVTLHVQPVARWIFAGGARGQGWEPARAVTAAALSSASGMVRRARRPPDRPRGP